MYRLESDDYIYYFESEELYESAVNMCLPKNKLPYVIHLLFNLADAVIKDRKIVKSISNIEQALADIDRSDLINLL